ncbi:homoserine dehydrogenase [Lactobacillus sp. S2-2]|uniref:homoserine dehydrogenase n=1 Tax=Lactobacillus sp. S2-2 TaxID=2692917 RepID=UPI001F00E5AC|nr:homoserine dehydrogenase [Lactobacillus sp. S2-2]MCF6515738.1 homoserine dehydrogenase [Lactobacillus sp. S2-2]
MKEIKIGLLGFGTVGEGFFKKLKANLQKIENEFLISIKITDIAVKHLEKYQNNELLKNIKLTNNYKEIINNSKIDLIIELMGGFDEAYDAIKNSLKNSKNVITANKEVLGDKLYELQNIAGENKVNIFFEASVAGGIPIIKTIINNFKYDEIKEISGILNGTSNFILTKMIDDNQSYNEALIEAQMLGYAETNPKRDVLGLDIESKLRILSLLSFDFVINEQIEIKGIDEVRLIDLKIAEKLGLKIKLIGSISKIRNQLLFEVSPRAIQKDTYFFNINGVINAISLTNQKNDHYNFSGPGAGMDATAQSVFSDLISFLKQKNNYLNKQNSSNYLEVNKLNLLRRYLIISKTRDDYSIEITSNIIEDEFLIEGYKAIITKEIDLNKIKIKNLKVYPIE